MAHVCERTCFRMSDSMFFVKLSFPSVLLNIRREHTTRRTLIRIQPLKFAMLFQSVIVVFSRSFSVV